MDTSVRYIYRLNSAPDTIVLDRGQESVSDFWRRLNERLQVTLRHSSAWNPETDGQPDIVNAAIDNYIFVSH